MTGGVPARRRIRKTKAGLRDQIRHVADDDRLDDEAALERIRALVRRPIRVTIGDRRPRSQRHDGR